MRLNPESIARASSRHPWRTVAVWLVIFVLAGAAELGVAGVGAHDRHRLHEHARGEGGAADPRERRLEQDIVTENWIIAGSEEGAVEDPPSSRR